MHTVTPAVRERSRLVLGNSAGRVWASAASLIIGSLGLPALLLTSRRLQKSLLAVVLLNISWQIQKHFFLREDAADLGSLGGLQVSLTTIGLAGLYAAWLIDCAIRSKAHGRERRHPSGATLPAALFLLFCSVSLLVASDTTLGIFEVVNVLERFLLYLYIVNKVSSREDVLFVVRLLSIGLIIQSLLMLAQAGGLLGTIDWYGIKARADFAGDSRVSGTLGSPNPAAAYLAMSMVFAISILFSGLGRVDKWLSGSGLALALLPLFFTSSRGGWLSFLAGCAILLLVSGARASRKTVTAVLLALILVVICFRSPIQERLFGDDHGSAAARMPLNLLALAMIEDHPLLGVGANNFGVGMRPYIAHTFSGNFLYTVHNAYLRIWAETGVGGLIAFLWFLISSVHRAFKSWRLQDHLYATLSLGCAAATIGFMIQMNVDPFRSGAAVHLLWLFGGLVTVLYRLSREPRAVPHHH
jgi:O-antigen ligase